MRKKEIVLSVVVLAALVLGFGAYQAYRWYEGVLLDQQRAYELSSVQNCAMGEAVTYSSDLYSREISFSGELSVRVDKAVLYSDIASSPIANATNVSNELFSSTMTGVDDFDLLMVDIVIKNLNAEPTSETQDGQTLFAMDDIAHVDPSTQPVYLSEGGSGAAFGYFDLQPGSERRFSVAYAIRHDDIDPNNLYVTGSGGLGYRVHLTVEDQRHGGA